MNLEPAKWIRGIKASVTMLLNAKAQDLRSKGVNVISLVVGEPDFNTPEDVKLAVKKAVDDNFTRYTSAVGILELRESIVKKLREQNNINYTTEQIVVSNGAKQALNMAISVLLEEGEELFIPAPYWVSYTHMATLSRVKANIVQTSFETEYKLTPELLSRYYNPKTKALLLNNPSNPTGVVYTKDELIDIVKWCVEHNVRIISDEVYERIVFGTDFIATASVSKDAYDMTMTVNGLSKSHAMTGWRVGFVAGPTDIIKAVANFQSHFSSHIPSFVQKASVVAFNNYEPVKAMVSAYKKRVDLAYNLLLELLPEIKLVKPQGAFYLFPDFSYYFDKLSVNDVEFCENVLDSKYVAIVPGSAFGMPNNIRISVATSEENIINGITRIAEFIEENT